MSSLQIDGCTLYPSGGTEYEATWTWQNTTVQLNGTSFKKATLLDTSKQVRAIIYYVAQDMFAIPTSGDWATCDAAAEQVISTFRLVNSP